MMIKDTKYEKNHFGVLEVFLVKKRLGKAGQQQSKKKKQRLRQKKQIHKNKPKKLIKFGFGFIYLVLNKNVVLIHVFFINSLLLLL